MKSKAAGCGSISTVISSIVLLCVSSTTTTTTTTTIIIIIIITIIIIIGSGFLLLYEWYIQILLGILFLIPALILSDISELKIGFFASG